MRPVLLVRVLLTLLLIPLLANGCAAGPAGDRPGSDPAQPPTSAACPAPTDSTGSMDSTVTVTEVDNGRTVCAAVSQRIEFYLHGTADRLWSPITAEGNPLSPTGSGKLSLAIGVTGAVFTAVAPGAAEVTSTRPTCASAPSGATCDSVVLFRVSVSVHS